MYDILCFMQQTGFINYLPFRNFWFHSCTCMMLTDQGLSETRENICLQLAGVHAKWHWVTWETLEEWVWEIKMASNPENKMYQWSVQQCLTCIKWFNESQPDLQSYPMAICHLTHYVGAKYVINSPLNWFLSIQNSHCSRTKCG